MGLAFTINARKEKNRKSELVVLCFLASQTRQTRDPPPLTSPIRAWPGTSPAEYVADLNEKMRVANEKLVEVNQAWNTMADAQDAASKSLQELTEHILRTQRPRPPVNEPSADTLAAAAAKGAKGKDKGKGKGKGLQWQMMNEMMELNQMYEQMNAMFDTADGMGGKAKGKGKGGGPYGKGGLPIAQDINVYDCSILWDPNSAPRRTPVGSPSGSWNGNVQKLQA